MAKYVIDGATLTAIANKIREKAPEAWGDDPITPEYMPSGVECAYDDGWDAGYNAGKAASGAALEALGELCEVATMVDSAEELVVAVYNRHPTYYLHCTMIHTNIGTVNVVVSPNSMKTYAVASIYKEFRVDNVRWKKSAT